MELEWHQLEMPYASLRAHSRDRQRRLRLCLEENGQRQPIVVVPEREAPGRYVVIDGHQRIAALRRLG
ncbi:MAG: ParB N-terminal domain-containing protein, partial [bacterium]|nr:ParB N-terminal domain-containing protein [bacterium]